MGQWHKVLGYRAHTHTRHQNSVIIYIFAENAGDVLKKYQKMPGIHRRPNPGKFPSIYPLSTEEETELERSITDRGRISLSKARKTWYYPELI